VALTVTFAFQNIMATHSSNTNSKIDLTKNEISRIEKALKDEEFVKLLGEYANEINDPENKKRYESEITQIERERGMSVIFINPKPGYVIKTKNLSCGTKVFLNICSDGNIGKPASKAETVSGSQGLQWSIPYSQSQPREDIDRSGEKCVVYDVIFHPDTMYLATRDSRMKGLVHSTALDALEQAFGAKCDRNNLKYPKMKFKGIFRPTIIRKPVEGLTEKPSINQDIISELASSKTMEPKYSLKYRSNSDLQDHVIQPANQIRSYRPKEIVVDIELPLLDSAAGVDLDVQEKSLCLMREEPPKYKLFIDLPYPVDEENGTAKFDKSKKCLAVTLPVKPQPQLKAERLSSNDSGIEEDTGYRTKNGDDIVMEAEEVSDSSPVKENPIETDDLFRTNTDLVDTFLEESVSYTLPGFSCSVQSNVIIFTLDVKNVSQESFERKLLPDNLAVCFKFLSIGAGFVQIHHAFALDFLIGGTVAEENIEVEFWDNNVVVQIPLTKDMESYKVGLSLSSLSDTLHKINAGQEEAGLEAQNCAKKKRNKYKHEKHPKVMKTKEEKEGKAGQYYYEGEKKTKERHSSGESMDSFMSESPMETIQLEDDGMKTEDSCDEDIQLLPPRYLRANSEDSQVNENCPRGILKRKTFEVVGNRFRCYSESNVEDLGWSSNDKLSFALSETKITEDEELVFSDQRKSVSFNEEVQQQFYRINSTILASTAKNKRKAEKKKRALERRMSEGDAGSLEDDEKLLQKKGMSTSSSVDLASLTKGWEDESHEDSGLASSYEETVILTGENVNKNNNNNSSNNKTKAKKMTKKRSKQFQMSNELIFDLDI